MINVYKRLLHCYLEALNAVRISLLQDVSASGQTLDSFGRRDGLATLQGNTIESKYGDVGRSNVDASNACLQGVVDSQYNVLVGCAT